VAVVVSFKQESMYALSAKKWGRCREVAVSGSSTVLFKIIFRRNLIQNNETVKITHSCSRNRMPFLVFFRDLRHLLRLPRGQSLIWTILPFGMVFRVLSLLVTSVKLCRYPYSRPPMNSTNDRKCGSIFLSSWARFLERWLSLTQD